LKGGRKIKNWMAPDSLALFLVWGLGGKKKFLESVRASKPFPQLGLRLARKSRKGHQPWLGPFPAEALLPKSTIQPSPPGGPEKACAGKGANHFDGSAFPMDGPRIERVLDSNPAGLAERDGPNEPIP